MKRQLVKGCDRVSSDRERKSEIETVPKEKTENERGWQKGKKQRKIKRKRDVQSFGTQTVRKSADMGNRNRSSLFTAFLIGREGEREIEIERKKERE